MFKYLWIIALVLTYTPWTLYILFDLVHNLLEMDKIFSEEIFDVFFDWFDDHMAWVFLHCIVLMVLIVVSFATWAQIGFSN